MPRKGFERQFQGRVLVLGWRFRTSQKRLCRSTSRSVTSRNTPTTVRSRSGRKLSGSGPRLTAAARCSATRWASSRRSISSTGSRTPSRTISRVSSSRRRRRSSASRWISWWKWRCTILSIFSSRRARRSFRLPTIPRSHTSSRRIICAGRSRRSLRNISTWCSASLASLKSRRLPVRRPYGLRRRSRSRRKRTIRVRARSTFW